MQHTFYKYFPLLVFTAIWVVVLYLNSLALFNLKEPSSLGLNLLYIGLTGIFVGYYVPSLFDRQYEANYRKRPIIEINEKLLIKLVLTLSFTSILGGLIMIYVIGNKLGGISIYADRPLMVRQEIVSMQLGDTPVPVFYRIGSYLSSIGFVCTIFGGILLSLKSNKRLIGLIPLIAILIPQIAVMGRYSFVNGLVFLFTAYILYSFYSKENRLLEFFGYTLLSAFIIGILSFYILKFRSPLEDNILSLLYESIYLYFSGGVTALDQFLYSDFQQTYGQSSFRTVFRWLERFGVVSKDEVIPPHNKFVNVNPKFNINTYTFVRSLYQDFGFYGYFCISILWGYFTRYFTMRVYSNFSIINIFFACAFIFSLFISFFSFYFQNISKVIYLLIVLLIIQYYLGDKLFKKELARV